MSQFNVTELDFDKIKTNLKDHFKLQSKYNDWNFEGSGLSVLLDVLAYNTHYNAMLAHFSLNETFLDSAQIRGNVVSHAKLLGYTPRSAISATAVVDVDITAGTNNPPQDLDLPRGTRFSSVIDSVNYTFVNLAPLTTSRVNGVYSFRGVVLKEGSLKRMLYRVDTTTVGQKFEIPDADADTSTLRIRVKANTASEQYVTYNRFTSFVNVNPNSLIYFIQENALGRYEIYFGDDTLGDKPQSNQIVEIEYVITNGPLANNGSTIEQKDTLLNGAASVDISMSALNDTNAINSAATLLTFGGASKESIESIKFNAPLTFVSQNRAVTADDYRSIISKEFGGIKSISVWGGEDNFIPNYGRVFISIKLEGDNDELLLNDFQKNQITSVILKGKNVVSITPVIVDPEYTYLKVESFFKYNPNLTDISRIELQAIVKGRINAFDDDNLNRFDGVFRYSQLLKQIDSANPAILNSFARVFMYKEFVPTVQKSNSVVLQFPGSIYGSTDDLNDTLTSTSFFQNGIEHYFGDSPTINTDPEKRIDFGDRTVYIYRVISNSRIRIRDAGTIFLNEGRIVLENFIPDSAQQIRVTVSPNSNDIAPKRNELLKISFELSSVVGEIDTVSVAGSIGAINYTTTPRHGN